MTLIPQEDKIFVPIQKEEPTPDPVTPNSVEDKVFVPLTPEEQKAEQTSTLESNWKETANINPDQLAEDEALAKKNGWPLWMVQRKPENKQLAKVQAEMPDMVKLPKDYATTANFLGIPRNMSLSRDDIENLKLTEDTLKGGSLRKIWDSLVSGYKETGVMQRFSELSYIKRHGGTLTDAQEAELSDLDLALEQDPGDIYEPVKGITSLARFMLKPMAETSKNLLPLAVGAGLATTVMTQPTGTGKMLAPVASTLSTVPGIVQAITEVGITSTVAQDSMKMESELAYRDMLKMKDEQGVPLVDSVGEETLGVIADWFGGVAGLMEIAPLEYFGKVIPGLKSMGVRQGLKAILARPTTRQAITSLAKNYLEGLLVESGTEAIQKGVTMVGEEYFKSLASATGVDVEPASAVEWGQALSNEFVGALQSFSLAMTMAPGMAFHADMMKVRQAETAKAMFEELAGAMADSKTRARMPSAMAEFVKEATKDGPLEYTYVDGEKFNTYLQEQGISPEEIASEINIKPEDIAEAVEQEGKIAISTSDYAAKIAGSDMGNALIGDVTFSPDGMTANEATAFQQEATEIQKREMAAAEQIMAEDTKRQEDLTYIKDSILTMGAAADYPIDTTEAVATVWAARGNTIADRYDINPRNWFDSIALQIRADEGLKAPGDYMQTIDVDLESDAFKKWFGDSEVVDEEGKPLIVFHGSDEEFSIFEKKMGTRVYGMRVEDQPANAFFFSPSEEDAKNYGENVKSFYLSIQKMLDDTASQEDLAYIMEPLLYTDDRGRLSIDSGMERFDVEQGNNEWVSLKLTDGSLDWDIMDNEEVTSRIQELGYDGVRITEDEDLSGESFAIFDPAKVKSTKNVGTWSTEEADIYKQERETVLGGQVSFYKDGKAIIDLFSAADRATLLHESGHVFLNDLYMTSKTNEQAREDFEAVKKWLNVEDWDAMTQEEDIRAQEKFARHFEAYLMNGEAPTVGLKRVFRAFKEWLLNIYKDVIQMSRVTREEIELTDDVKDIFDRLLATDQQIEEAKIMAGYDSAVEATEESIQKHDDASDSAKETAGKVKSKKALKARRKELTKRIKTELEASQGYTALNSMRRSAVKGGVKANEKDLIELYGEEYFKEYIKPLRISSKRSTWQFDDLAMYFGYGSGDEMIQELVTLPDLRKAIKNQVDTMMATEATIDQLEAQGLIRNEEQLEALSIERENIASMTPKEQERRAKSERTEFKRAYSRKAIKDRVEAVKKAAQKAISGKKASTVQPRQYLAAERKAKLAVERALRDNNFEEAARQKDIQIINAALAGEATRVKRELNSIHKYLKKMSKAKYGKKATLAFDYTDQIHALLDPLNLGPKSKRLEAEMASFLEWKKQQEDEGNVVVVPPRLLAKLGRIPYSDMTVGDLRDLRDSIKNLEHLGKMKKKLITAKDKRDFETTVNDLVDIAYKNVGEKFPENFDPNVTRAEKAATAVRGLHASMTRMEFLLRKLDGDVDTGPFWQTFFRPVVDAQNAEMVMKEDAMSVIGSLFKEMGTKNLSKLKFYPSVGLNLKKENILAMALNMGNEGNYERLVLGHKLDEAQITALMDTLTKEDWDFVQGVWDYIDSYWPEIAALEKRLTGVAPKKVEARPIRTPYGTYRGGYYPVVYNPLKSVKSFEHAEKKATADFVSNQYFRAQTRHGHTEARAGHGGRQLRLDLGVIGEHLSQVIHDLAFREVLIDIDRLNKDETLQKALVETVGVEMQRQFKPWLQHIAGSGFTPLNNFERILARARKGVTVGVLGLKMTTIAMQFMSAFGAEERLGQAKMIHSLYDFYHDPTKWKKKVDFVKSKSVEIRNRSRTFERDIRDTINNNLGTGKHGKVITSFFYLHGMMDSAAVIPIWLEAYDKKLAESGSDEKAVYYADSIIRQTQPASNPKDMPDIMRGHESRKLITMFYSYFSVFYNLMASRLGTTKGMRDMPRLVASTVWMVIVPAVLGQLMTGRGPDDDEDPVDWAVKTALLYPLNGIPIIRDVASAATSGFGYTVTPAAQAFQSTSQLVSSAINIFQGDKEPLDILKPLIEVAGYWGGFPVGQTKITIGQFLDYISGEEAEYDLRDIFFKRKE